MKKFLTTLSAIGMIVPTASQVMAMSRINQQVVEELEIETISDSQYCESNKNVFKKHHEQEVSKEFEQKIDLKGIEPNEIDLIQINVEGTRAESKDEKATIGNLDQNIIELDGHSVYNGITEFGDFVGNSQHNSDYMRITVSGRAVITNDSMLDLIFNVTYRADNGGNILSNTAGKGTGFFNLNTVKVIY